MGSKATGIVTGLVLWSGGLAVPAHGQDWTRIADQMISRSLRLAAGERVIIHYDPSRDRDLIEQVRLAILRSGGVIAAELTWPAGARAAWYGGLTAEAFSARVALEDSSYARLFAGADVYLWLHAAAGRDAPRRWEKLIANSGVRAIHSHWALPPDSAEGSRAAAMYERAIAIDPALLDQREQQLETRLRGARARLTSPGGTDLTFTVPADAHFHRNTGDASRAKVARARSTRDREEELPAGALRTTDLRDAEGTLVATTIGGTRAGTVRVTFRGGRVASLAGDGPGGGFIARGHEGAGGDRDLPSELVIGVNDELRPVLPSGYMPYYGYGAGIVRIAIGDNWESGGRNRTRDHWEAWLFVTDGTLTAGSATLIRDGRLVP
jgi:hypothetical protein